MGKIINVDFVNRELIEEELGKKDWTLIIKNPFFKGVAAAVGLVMAFTAWANYSKYKEDQDKGTNSTTSNVSEAELYNPNYNTDSISVILVTGDEKYHDIVGDIESTLNDYGVYTQAVNDSDEALKLAKEYDENPREILVIGVGGYENNNNDTIVLGNMSDAIKGEVNSYANNSSSLALCLAVSGDGIVRSGYYSASTGKREATSLERTFINSGIINSVRTTSVAIPSNMEDFEEIKKMVVAGAIKYSGLTLLERNSNYFLIAGNSNVKTGSKQFGTTETASDYQDTVYIGSGQLLNNLQQPINWQNIIKSKPKG